MTGITDFYGKMDISIKTVYFEDFELKNSYSKPITIQLICDNYYYTFISKHLCLIYS